MSDQDANDNNDNLERLLAELQALLDQEAAAIFSPTVLELARQPRNMGALLEPDAHAVVRGPCSDTMEIYLRLNGAQIQQATFMTDGCGPTVACGSMITTLAQGRSVGQAAAIRPEDLVAALDGLPDEHLHCAGLAVTALRTAIAHCLQEGRL